MVHRPPKVSAQTCPKRWPSPEEFPFKAGHLAQAQIMNEEEIVTLLSSDHQEFKVSRLVAEKSEAVRCIIAETSVDSPVPLMNVRAKILQKVIEFCQFEVDASGRDGEKGTKSSDEVRLTFAPAVHTRAPNRAIRIAWECS